IAATSGPIDNYRITGCTFSNSARKGLGWDGFGNTVTNFVVAGCTFENNGLNGIAFNGFSSSQNNNAGTISGCSFYEEVNPIQLGSLAGFTISGCTMFKTRGSAQVYLDDCHQGSIVGNSMGNPSVSMTGSPSITFASGGHTITRATGSFITDGFVVGNTVTVGGSTSNNGTHGPITSLSATVMTFASGITTEGPDSGVTIAVSNDTNGVLCQDNIAVCTFLSLVGNTIYNLTDTGIVLVGVTDSVIASNNINGNAYGIKEESGATRNLIYGNNSSGNSTANYVLLSSASVEAPSITFPGTSAASGLLRGPTASNWIAVRNSGNSADVVIVQTDASADAFFGAPGFAGASGIPTATLGADSAVWIGVDGSKYIVCNTTGIGFYPGTTPVAQ